MGLLDRINKIPRSRFSVSGEGCQHGFSLVEILVVIAIFTIISVIGLASYNRGNNETLLTSLAYDIALSVRQAQSYGISVREAVDVGGDFVSGYGIHFDASESESYIFFADTDDDQVYDGDIFCTDECIDNFVLGRGYTMEDVCAVLSDDTEHCTQASDINHLDIMFQRPDPEAIFGTSIYDPDDLNNPYKGAYIKVQSVYGTERIVTISSAGQISVSK